MTGTAINGPIENNPARITETQAIGEPLHTYTTINFKQSAEGQRGKRLLKTLAGVGFGFIALIIGEIALKNKLSESTQTGLFAASLFGCATTLYVAVGLLHWSIKRLGYGRQQMVVHIGPRGMMIMGHGGSETHSWSELKAITLDAVDPVGDETDLAARTQRYTLQWQNGTRSVIDSRIENLIGLGRDLEVQQLMVLLPVSLAQIEAGQKATFGSIAVTKDGVEYRNQDKHLKWTDMSQPRFARGQFCLREHNVAEDWAVLSPAFIPNLRILIALVDAGIKRFGVKT